MRVSRGELLRSGRTFGRDGFMFWGHLLGNIGNILFKLRCRDLRNGWRVELHQLLLGVFSIKHRDDKLFDLLCGHLFECWGELMFKLHGGNIRAKFRHGIVLWMCFRHVFFVFGVKHLRQLRCGHLSIWHRTNILLELSGRQLLCFHRAVCCDCIVLCGLLLNRSCQYVLKLRSRDVSVNYGPELLHWMHRWFVLLGSCSKLLFQLRSGFVSSDVGTKRMRKLPIE